ncbi:MAG: hypothetical protein ACI89J_000040 [Hyphomicrobiaceae bacterium]|jgi:hypothetical protein
MFRWMVSRPALFVAGITAGVFGSHHFTASSKTSEIKQVVAKATNKVAPKEAATLVKFEPLPEANDKVKRLQITRIAGVANPLSSAERVAVAKIPVVKISEARRASTGRASIGMQANPVVLRELARNIQTELARVGCRSVAASGRWDSRTVRATAKFLSNRNALLPSDRPDVVLLTMLRGYQGSGCGLVEHQAIANRVPIGAASQPVTIRSASLPAAAYATGTYAGAAQAINTDMATPLQPVGRRAVLSKTRPKSQQSNRSRPTSHSRRKKRQSWRQKVHYGNGLDG